MAPSKKGLTSAEIEQIMNDFNETYADSDSDCEMENAGLDSSLVRDATLIPVDPEELDNDDENENENLGVIRWIEPSSSTRPKVHSFCENSGPNTEVLENEVQAFRVLFSEKSMEILERETNRYADQHLQKANDPSSKRHSL